MATFLDWASTAPLHPAARQALLAAIDEGWADPQRLYRAARQARELLDASREVVAGCLGARADEVFFTANGTDALHLGIAGLRAARSRVGADVVASAVEHSAVLSAVPGARLVGVDRTGRVDPGEYAAALSPTTALACLQSANHEVGTTQPVEAVAEACAAAGVPLLVDACQTAGRQPVPGGWSVLAASAHKWGGPPGVGVLAVRKGTRFSSPSQDERGYGRVRGFENVPAVVAAAAALRARQQEQAEEAARLASYADRLREQLPRVIPDTEVLGHPTERLPHLVTASFLYVDGEALLSGLDAHGIAASSGSSCTSSTLEPSHVLVAMGVLTHGNLRLSMGRDTGAADVEHLLAVLPGVVAGVRARLGAP